MLDEHAFLFEDPANLLKQELRDPITYNSIISAIASGRSKVNEIATLVGIETGPCTIYLNNLMSLGIVQKICP